MDQAFLLGNEAIARGAIEADVRFVSCYPGTPSSEVAQVFAKLPKDAGIYFEYSVNEKVAVELAAAVALCGMRSLSIMKHVGVNVAADPMMSLAYVGVVGGMVLVSADDPSCHSSQNEQDNRLYARFFNIPMLEPSSVQEAKDMARYAFEISKTTELPVMLRITTRLSHARGLVTLNEPQKIEQHAEFIKDPRYIERLSAHQRLLARMDQAALLSEQSPLNKEIHFGADAQVSLGIVTSGVSFGFVADVLESAGLSAKVFKVGFSHPVPEKKLAAFLVNLERVIVVEELEPYLEDCVWRLAKTINPRIDIVGKRSGHFSFDREYDTDLVTRAISRVSASIPNHLSSSREQASVEDISTAEPALSLPHRYSTLCPGCSHRNTYYAVKRVFGDRAIYSSDIGCYSLGIVPPIRLGDIWLCMSSGVGLAGGFAFACPDTPVVAFIGDGTFLHSGIPALLNAMHNQHDFILVVMDNGVTAMTGHQPNPASETRDQLRESSPSIELEQLIRALGVEEIRVVNPREIASTIQALRELKKKHGVRVLLARQPCVVNLRRRNREMGSVTKFTVRQESCKLCAICIKDYSCPAFYLDAQRNVQIDQGLCLGCADCVQICPHQAIVETST